MEEYLRMTLLVNHLFATSRVFSGAVAAVLSTPVETAETGWITFSGLTPEACGATAGAVATPIETVKEQRSPMPGDPFGGKKHLSARRLASRALRSQPGSVYAVSPKLVNHGSEHPGGMLPETNTYAWNLVTMRNSSHTVIVRRLARNCLARGNTRTTLDLPGNLIEKVISITKARTQEAAVTIALGDIAEQDRINKLIAFHAKVPLDTDLDVLRKR